MLQWCINVERVRKGSRGRPIVLPLKAFSSVEQPSQSRRLLRLFHELTQIDGSIAAKLQSTDMLELQIYFRSLGEIRMGSALIPGVQTPKEIALLGGSFLIGLGALEVCLRFSGFWGNNHENLLATGVDAGSVVPKVRFLTAKLAKSCHVDIFNINMTWLF